MAYVSQEDKKALTPAIKAVLKKYNMKASIAVRHHSTLVVNIKEGALDILGAMKRNALQSNRFDLNDIYEIQRLNYLLEADHINVNEYWISENYGKGEVCNFLTELKSVMEGSGFFNEDDSMTDYFHRSHYIDINVGNWSSPYVCTTGAEKFEPVQVQGVAA